jgi:hypothetical protein
MIQRRRHLYTQQRNYEKRLQTPEGDASNEQQQERQQEQGCQQYERHQRQGRQQQQAIQQQLVCHHTDITGTPSIVSKKVDNSWKVVKSRNVGNNSSCCRNNSNIRNAATSGRKQ